MDIVTQAERQVPREWLKPHPVLELPTQGQMRRALAGAPEDWDRFCEALKQRADKMRLEQLDPLNHGFAPECWRDMERLIDEGFEEICIFGANREGKTEGLARYVARQLTAAPCEWAMFHNTATTSQQQQQRRLYAQLPPEIRKAAKSKGGLRTANTYLKFTEAAGFSNDTLILPGTGSQGYFFNYRQGADVWEGPEYDGGWFDELVPVNVLETFRFRRGRDRRLLVIVTFTPKMGYTPTVQNIVAGMRIVETRPAALLSPTKVHVPGCPEGHMPYIAHGRMEKQAIMWFHNQMNPFGAGAEVAQALVGAPDAKIKIRGYGWADKSVSGAFPKFGKAHIVSRERVAELLAGPGSMYCVADGGDAKNWFITWWWVTPEGWSILVREWPDMPTYGEWAMSPAEATEEGTGSSGTLKRNDWRPGEAQRLEAGRSISSYKALILEIEGWRYNEEAKRWEANDKTWKVERRIMDPRFGGKPVPSDEQGTTIISLMADDLNRANGQPNTDMRGRQVPGMDWEPAPGGAVEAGNEQLASLMDWNEEELLSPQNCPRFYVSEECEQSRIAYEEFTMLSTKANSLKDPVDCGRYFAVSDCIYMEPDRRKMKRQGRHW